MHLMTSTTCSVVALCAIVLATGPATVVAADTAGGPPAVESAPSAMRLYVVRIETSDPEEISFLDTEIDVWHVDRKRGVVEAGVDSEDLEMLNDLGFRYLVDQRLTEKYNTLQDALKDQTEGIPGYSCYRTVEETLATGAALATAHPDLAEWIDIGDSWEKVTPGGLEGYDLMVLRLTNTTNGIPSSEKPKLWVMGSIHAREYVSPETATRFAEHLLANYGIDPDVTWVLDHHEIHILLVTNPDGRKHAESGLSWRKNTNENYCSPTSNYRGADLNRNNDFEWIPYGSECSETYSGPFAASEPETQAMHSWLYANFPDWRPDDLTTPAPDNATGIFIDIHSYGQEILGAFVWRALPEPNQTQAHRLGRKLTFFTGYHAYPGGGYGGSYQGTTKDFGYGRLGMPAYTFELGTEFFQECPPFEATIYPTNLEVLLYATRAVRAPYTQSSGPDVVAPAAVPSTPSPGETVTITAVIDDTRYGPGETSPAVSVESIAAAELYVDVPPWEAGAAPIAMTAVDGVFDSTSEAVTGSFSSVGLGDGRHTVFIRGQDAADYWGTVRAVWVWVLDPASAGRFAGLVSDAETGLPVVAAISAGAFTTMSAPATGSYELLLPAGTYDVTVSADGYGPQTVAGAEALSGETTLLDFELNPIQIVFEDDVEGGDLGWTTQGQWATTQESSASPTHSWTDSPGGDYGNSWNYSLISPVFDLSDVTGVRLEFKQIYELETGFDYGFVEISSDGGSSWSAVATVNGFHTSSWSTEQIELPELDNSPNARFRFRIDTDGFVTEDGWHIDDIVLSGATSPPPGLLFRDGFESGDTMAWGSTSP
jgi:hypothetical protein